MKRSNRSLVVICLATIILVVVLYGMLNAILMHQYGMLEEHEVFQNSERVLNQIAYDVRVLQSVAINWAGRKESRDFFKTLDSTLVGDLLSDSSLTGLQLDGVALLDKNGQLVAQAGVWTDKYSDQNHRSIIKHTVSIWGRLGKILRRHPRGVAGIVGSPIGPLQIALAPTESDSLTGQTLGAVCLVRYLDEKAIKRIADRMKMKLVALAPKDPGIPPDLRAVFPRFPDISPLSVRALSDNIVSAYIDLKDIYGNPTVVLRMDESRDIHRQGGATAAYLLISLITVGSVFGLITVLLVNRTERALAASEEKYRTVVENQTELICRFLPDGTCTFINEAFSRSIGVVDDDLTGLNFFTYVADHDRRELKEHLSLLSRVAPSATHEYRLRSMTGEHRWMEWTHQANFDKKGHLVEIQSVGRDISELKRALRDSEEAKDRIDAILRSVSEGLIVTDVKNHILLMNRGAEILLAVKSVDAKGMPIQHIVEDSSIVHSLQRVLSGEVVGMSYDLLIPSLDNTQRILRARSSVIRDKSGTDTGVVTIIFDVTEERTVDRMKTEFVSTAAHQLRTPLTSIQGFSDLLLERNLPTDDQIKFVRYISEEAENLAGIVDDLLDIARIEAHEGFALKLDTCNASEIINELVQSLSSQQRQHEFQTIISEDCPSILADKSKLRQILENILSNAVKYSPNGGLIRIKVEPTIGACRFSIKDQGMGMKTETLDRMFDKFYRADASDTSIPGTGLGMTIVKYMVEAHGGEVNVQSEYGEGTCVTFTIPASDSLASSRVDS
jgi:PAS domain S-box-containing protein